MRLFQVGISNKVFLVFFFPLKLTLFTNTSGANSQIRMTNTTNKYLFNYTPRTKIIRIFARKFFWLKKTKSCD